MTSDSPYCPFCNGVLPPLTASPSSEKLNCPRCGEPVAASRWPIDVSLQPSENAKTDAVQREKGLGVRKTAFFVLGLMLVMALIGLGFALGTRDVRRSRDPKVVFKPRKPLELTGLGYLPQGCQLVAGLQIAEMTDESDKVGKEMLANPRPAVLDWVFRQIQRSSGLKSEQLDHILLAPLPLSKRLVMIVKIRPEYPYREVQVNESIKTRKSKHEDRWLYEIALQPIGEAMLWHVDEQTLVYVLAVEPLKLDHLAGLSATPRNAREVLAKPVYDVLANRLPRHHLMWAAGQTEQLQTVATALMLLPDGKTYLKQLEPWKEVKTFALGLEPAEDYLTMVGNFRMANANAASQLKQFLEGEAKKDTKKRQKVEIPPAEETEQWLTWHMRTDAADIRAWLSLDWQGKQ